MAFDLDAYLARVGYTGDRAPTLSTLQALHLRHALTIPFENLNPLLGWPVALDVASLEAKLVRGGRGGYCYEHNLLFDHALRALGFRTAGLGARVLWNAPAGAVRPRSHMLILVELDRPYIADVGFGGLTMTGPLALVPGAVQDTPHEPFRLVADGTDYLLQARVGDEWRTLYRFDLAPQLLPDYEVTSWYLCHHPTSHFVTQLVAARALPGRRLALRNAELAVHAAGGTTERRVLASGAELRTLLEGDFGLRLPGAPELDAALDRIARGAF